MSEVVEVYRNIHKSKKAMRPIYSIRSRATGRVIGHSDLVVLADAKFVVSEAGRQRVLREKAKNVHAVVRGTLLERRPDSADINDAVGVTYNPYKYSSFVSLPEERAVRYADFVTLTGQVMAWGPVGDGE